MNLRLQKRLAMELLRGGRKAVWLDPEQAERISMTRTRAGIRELIEEGVIQKKALRPRQRPIVAPQYWSRFKQQYTFNIAFRRRKDRQRSFKRRAIDRAKVNAAAAAGAAKADVDVNEVQSVQEVQE